MNQRIIVALNLCRISVSVWPINTLPFISTKYIQGISLAGSGVVE